MEIIKNLKVNGVEALLDYETSIANKPSIPQKTSEIENDSQFITLNEVPEPNLENYYNKEETIDVIDRKIADIEIPTPESVDLSEYAKKTELPTKTSQLENDSNFVQSTTVSTVVEQIMFRLQDLENTTVTEEEVTSIVDNKLNDVTVSWDDLENKPFYSEGVETVDVVSEKTFNFTLDAQYGSIGIYSCNPVFSGELSNYFILEENKNYKVKWDNQIYDCNGIAFNSNGVVGIGNASLLYAGEDTKEPFVILYIPNFSSVTNHVTFMTKSTASSHNLRIYQENEIVHPIEIKYIKQPVLELFNSAIIDALNTEV